MKTHLQTPVIVVDAESYRPMAWSDGQFCFVDPMKTTSVRLTGFAVKTYKRMDALHLIKAHHAYRKKHGFSPDRFMLMFVTHGKNSLNGSEE